MKKFITFILCFTLICTSFMFTAFASGEDADENYILCKYDFEELIPGESTGASYIKTGGQAKDAYRTIVEGTNPADGTTGNQLKITISHISDKHKFRYMFDDECYGVDGIYTLSAYVKLDESSATESNNAIFDIFDDEVNGFIDTKANPTVITKDEWVKMSYDYYYNPESRIADTFCIRLNDVVVEGQEPVILLDDVTVTEKKVASHNFDDPNYNYTQVAIQAFPTNGTTYGFNSGSSERSVTSKYNYSNQGDYSIVFNNLANGQKYRVRTNSSSTGIMLADDLVVGNKYRYSVMARLHDEATQDTAKITLGLHADTSKANPGSNKETGPVEICKGSWTKLYFVDTPTSTAKYTSMAIQNKVDGTTLKVVVDDFKIEAMSLVPIQTSFTYGNETVRALSEAGDYTANVIFNDTFTEDGAAIIFAKYINGALEDVAVVNRADLTNGNTHTFNIAEDELKQALITVFVWNSTSGMSNLVDRISIE